MQIVAFAVLGVGLLLTFVVILYEVACKRHPSHHYQNYRYSPTTTTAAITTTTRPGVDKVKPKIMVQVLLID